MKKQFFLSIFLGLLFVCLIGVSSPVRAGMEINSSYAIVIDAHSGQILYGKNPYTLSSSGDFDKLLAIITALQFENAPQELTVTKEAVLYNPNAPYLGLKEGQTVKLTDMLYAMYLGGYNDAANVVAENLGQTLIDTTSKEYAAMKDMQKTEAAIDAFVKKMNTTADELFCPTMKSTNADGHFYDTQQCSPLDMAMLIRSAVKNDSFRKLFMTSSYTITGDPDAVNNQAADHRDKYDKLTDEEKKANYASRPKESYPLISDASELEKTKGKVEIKTTNLLFDGSILYSGITGGICAYNSNAEKYHCAVYAKNDDRSLIAVVMNGSENGVYEDLQALLNFGFYKWETAEISDGKLGKMLPENISSRDLAFTGKKEFLLPSGYGIGDLDTAVAYTENGYLSGTITLTLPEEASYAGTITTISFYEKNERSLAGPILKIGGIILGILVVLFLIVFLRRAFGPQSKKSKAYIERMKKTARKQRERNKQEQGSEPSPDPSRRKPSDGLYTDPYSEKEYYGKIAGDRYQKKEKSENRRNYERIREKKKAKKRSNRSKTNRNTL